MSFFLTSVGYHNDVIYEVLLFTFDNYEYFEKLQTIIMTWTITLGRYVAITFQGHLSFMIVGKTQLLVV